MIQIRSNFKRGPAEAQEGSCGGRPPDNRDDARMLSPTGVKIQRWWSHLTSLFLASQTHHRTLVSSISALLLLALAVEPPTGQPNITLQECVPVPPSEYLTLHQSEGRGGRQEKIRKPWPASTCSLHRAENCCISARQKKCLPPTADNSLEWKLFVGFTFKLQGNVWLCNYTRWNAARLLRNCVVSVHNRRRINPPCTFLKSDFGRLTHIWSHILMSCEYKRFDANPPVSIMAPDWLWTIYVGLAGVWFSLREWPDTLQCTISFFNWV